MRCVVEVAPGAASFRADCLVLRIDANTLHAPKVDDQAVVTGPKARDTVTTTTDRQQHVMLASEIHSCHHVCCIRSLDDERRAAIVHSVVNSSRLIVGAVIGLD